jgi:trk system potassium uptake protein TrkA
MGNDEAAGEGTPPAGPRPDPGEPDAERAAGMRIIVIGCGRVGAELAFRMYQKGSRIVVVDRDPHAFGRLHPDFRGRIVEGDVLSEDVLHRSGVEQADGLAAVTTSDSINAVVGHLARSVYRVPVVVVRNFDPRWRRMIEAFGLDLVSSSSWATQRFEQKLAPPTLHSVCVAGNGEVEIYQVAVPESCVGLALSDLTLDGECALAALSRAGRAVVPTADMRLETGDILHVSATNRGLQHILRQLGLA